MGGVCFISKGWRDTKQRELGIRWGRARTLRFPVAPRKYCGFLRYVRERKLVAAWPHCPLKRQADRHFRKYVSAPTGNTLARANFPAKSCHVSYICTYIYVAPINLYFSPFSLSLSRGEIFGSCRQRYRIWMQRWLSSFPRPRASPCAMANGIDFYSILLDGP